MKKHVIKITKNDKEICRQFAEDCVDTNTACYARRGQSNRFKIIEDIYLGKLGEMAVYRLLRRHGIWVQKPDFAIYTGRQKSFDADLEYKGNKFHVKSQGIASASKYGKSYLMQKSDKLIKADCGTNNYLVPCLVKEDVIEVYGIIRFDEIKRQGMISKPKIQWLEKTKVAIYLDELVTLSYYYRWSFLNKER